MVRFPISYNRPMRLLLIGMGLGPRHSLVDVDEQHLTVKMGWAFRANVPRNNVVAAVASRRTTISIGVHGWRGRWLVNGSGRGLVEIDIAPPSRGWVLGVPVKLRQIIVSAVDPDALVAAIGDQGDGEPN
jgi:hypothetical protein